MSVFFLEKIEYRENKIKLVFVTFLNGVSFVLFESIGFSVVGCRSYSDLLQRSLTTYSFFPPKLGFWTQWEVHIIYYTHRKLSEFKALPPISNTKCASEVWLNNASRSRGGLPKVPCLHSVKLSREPCCLPRTLRWEDGYPYPLMGEQTCQRLTQE